MVREGRDGRTAMGILSSFECTTAKRQMGKLGSMELVKYDTALKEELSQVDNSLLRRYNTYAP